MSRDILFHNDDSDDLIVTVWDLSLGDGGPPFDDFLLAHGGADKSLPIEICKNATTLADGTQIQANTYNVRWLAHRDGAVDGEGVALSLNSGHTENVRTQAMTRLVA